MAFGGCHALDGPERLIAELQARGLAAVRGTTFITVLLGGDGTSVCIGNESVSVYLFADQGAAQAAAATVDRDDPSMVGNAVVEWVGSPRFWQRDRSIILYVGEDAAIDATLRAILGRPFAEAIPGGGRGRPGEPRCERAA